MSPSYELKSAGSSGNGVFATRTIKRETLILHEERPLLAILDSPQLRQACSWCFLCVGEIDEKVSLSVCAGCRLLRFCGKACQSAAWKHSHKLECKIYLKLYPNILPNTSRMVLQLLVRWKAGTIPENQWNLFIKLQHHMDNFKKLTGDGKEMYGNIKLMARAAQEYSGTGEDLGLVEMMTARVLINTLTLPTPLYTPIGLALSLPVSNLNHSCAPNCIVSFSGPNLTLRALNPINKDTELTISYTDTSSAPEIRRGDLLSRYFFYCTCRACTSSQTLGKPDPPPAIATIRSEKLKEVENAAIEHLFQATAEDALPSETLAHLARALVLFESYPEYPAYRYPISRVRSDLVVQLLRCGHWTPALLQSLINRFDADSVALPEDAHPVKVARTWVLAKLVMQMKAISTERDAGSEGEAAKQLSVQFGIDYRIVVWVLVADVARLAGRSHGAGTVLQKRAKEVVGQMRRAMQQAMIEEPGKDLTDETWVRLRRVAAKGWKWWKAWEGERRKTSSLVLIGSDAAKSEGIAVLVGEEK